MQMPACNEMTLRIKSDSISTHHMFLLLSVPVQLLHCFLLHTKWQYYWVHKTALYLSTQGIIRIDTYYWINLPVLSSFSPPCDLNFFQHFRSHSTLHFHYPQFCKSKDEVLDDSQMTQHSICTKMCARITPLSPDNRPNQCCKFHSYIITVYHALYSRKG